MESLPATALDYCVGSVLHLPSLPQPVSHLGRLRITGDPHKDFDAGNSRSHKTSPSSTKLAVRQIFAPSFSGDNVRITHRYISSTTTRWLRRVTRALLLCVKTHHLQCQLAAPTSTVTRVFLFTKTHGCGTVDQIRDRSSRNLP